MDQKKQQLYESVPVEISEKENNENMMKKELANENNDDDDDDDDDDNDNDDNNNKVTMTHEQTYCLKLFEDCPEENFFVHGYPGVGKSHLMTTYTRSFDTNAKRRFRDICQWITFWYTPSSSSSSSCVSDNNNNNNNTDAEEKEGEAKSEQKRNDNEEKTAVYLHHFPIHIARKLKEIPPMQLQWWAQLADHPLFTYIIQIGLAYFCVPLELHLVCPTGVAANNIGGKTVHSFFRINYEYKDPLWTTFTYQKQRKHFCHLYKRFLYCARRYFTSCSLAPNAGSQRNTQPSCSPVVRSKEWTELEKTMEDLYMLLRKNPKIVELRSMDTLVMDEFSMVPPHLFYQMHHSLCAARDDHKDDRLPVSIDNMRTWSDSRLTDEDEERTMSSPRCGESNNNEERDTRRKRTENKKKTLETRRRTGKDKFHGPPPSWNSSSSFSTKRSICESTNTTSKRRKLNTTNTTNVHKDKNKANNCLGSENENQEEKEEQEIHGSQNLEDDTLSEDTCDDPVPPYADGPFGCVRVILVGDLCQLPAICPPHESPADECIRTYLYITCTQHRNNVNWLGASPQWRQAVVFPPRRDKNNTPYTPSYTFHTSLFRYMFHPHRNILQLNTPVRQSSDPEFFHQLTKIRLGKMDDDVRSFLQSLENTRFPPWLPPLYVFPTRADASRKNETYLRAIIQRQPDMLKRFYRREWVEKSLPKDVYQGYAGTTITFVAPPSSSSSSSSSSNHRDQATSNTKVDPTHIKWVQSQVRHLEHSPLFHCVPNYVHMSPRDMRDMRLNHKEPGNWYQQPWLLVGYPRIRPQTADADDICQQLLLEIRRSSTHEKTLELVESLPVLLTRNLMDAKYGLVNGSRGVVIGFARIRFSMENGPSFSVFRTTDVRLKKHRKAYRAIALRYIREQLGRSGMFDCTQGPTYEVPLVHFPRITPPESIKAVDISGTNVTETSTEGISSSSSFERTHSTNNGHTQTQPQGEKDEEETRGCGEGNQRKEEQLTNVTKSSDRQDRLNFSDFFQRVVPLLPVADKATRQEPPWRAVCTQIPLLPAAALTVHRLQSLTLDAGELHFGPHNWGNSKSKRFRYAQAYVALSRFRGRDVRLATWSEDSIVQDPHVLRFVQQFLPLPDLARLRGDVYPNAE